MRAHRSQVQEATLVEPSSATDHPVRPEAVVGWFGLSNDILQPIYGRTWLRVDPDWCTPEALRATLTDLTRPGSAVDHPHQPGDHDQPGREAAASDEPPRWYLMAMGLFTVLLGVVFAIAGTAFHRWTPPLGVIMALVAVAAGGVLARTFADRRGAVGYAVAVLVTIFLATWWRPGGDVLVAAQPIGYVWLVGSLVVGCVGLAAPRGWFRDEP